MIIIIIIISICTGTFAVRFPDDWYFFDEVVLLLPVLWYFFYLTGISLTKCGTFHSRCGTFFYARKVKTKKTGSLNFLPDIR